MKIFVLFCACVGVARSVQLAGVADDVFEASSGACYLTQQRDASKLLLLLFKDTLLDVKSEASHLKVGVLSPNF